MQISQVAPDIIDQFGLVLWSASVDVPNKESLLDAGVLDRAMKHTDIGQIVHVIGEVNAIVTTIAAAIEEQSTVTREVAENISQATQDVQDANQRSAEMSTVSRDIARDIEVVDGITGDFRTGGEQVQASAEELSRLAEQLNGLVSQFKI